MQQPADQRQRRCFEKSMSGRSAMATEPAAR
jgi:hypothetical protein